MSRDFMPRQVKTILGVELRSRAWLRGDGWSSLTVRRSASGVEIRSPFNVVGVPISRVSALAFVRSYRLVIHCSCTARRKLGTRIKGFRHPFDVSP